MSTIAPRLSKQKEKLLLELFQDNVKFCLLYKGSFHGFHESELKSRCAKQGRTVIVGYLESGLIVGGYTSQCFISRSKAIKDEEAFIFTIDETKSSCFPVKTPENAVTFSTGFNFGGAFFFGNPNNYNMNYIHISSNENYESTLPEGQHSLQDVEVYRVQDVGDLLDSPWRDVSWTDTTRWSEKVGITLYKPSVNSVSQARVLLVGPVGAGKSSFISSVNSVFCNKVFNLAMVGTGPGSFTKKLKSYNIKRERGGDGTALVFCDMMGLGETKSSGVNVRDIMSVLKGHVQDGYQFIPSEAIEPGATEYIQKPTLKDKIHCVAFVVDACKLDIYHKHLEETFQELRSEISELGIHQVVLLTHIDEVCHAVGEDVKYVYRSRFIQQQIQKAAKLFGMSVSCIVPVKNYSSELELNDNTDVLILRAVNLMLLYADAFLDENKLTQVHK
ncbi:interferon-induced protein 44-like isoform X1 [Acipenser oxyrinchus oxyrinchus]|uniref:Interferon-induced protein 44-like isoform X1 n=1 Tax=Acipenser oxyrinchus oxyrinchus TaxID=40147 RepID=A0AAD8DAE9_ACIOX|nr:interferon-induced protein 44-like isoform X1 [Acipenser oxyrinchus oxyrinchus]